LTRARKSPETAEKGRERGFQKMKETKDVLRVVGIILLALFVLAVGVPLVLAAAGVALGILGFLIGLAVLLIKLAIVAAIIYLIVVGIRAVLK
jgi:small-conductance mechanosensitive channel